jgi:hypothetical protein
MLSVTYFLILGLNALIECVTAFVLGLRKRSEMQAVLLVNLVTHPILTYVIWVNAHYRFFDLTLGALFIAELCVVAVEWGMLVVVLRERPYRLLAVTLAMNLASVVVGIIVVPPATIYY